MNSRFHHHLRTGLALIGAWACAVLAAEPGYLGANEIRDLITGNSIQSQDVDSGMTFWVYFNPNGRRSALQDDGEYELPWRVLDDGTHCVRTGTGDDCARVRQNENGTWSRVREGKAVIHWLRIEPGKSLRASAPGPGIYLRRRGLHDLEFTLVAAQALGEREAQARIAAAATTACSGLLPVPGKYRFESTQPVSDASGTKGTYQFIQQVSCVQGTARVETAARRPTLSSPEESRQVEEDIRRRSEAYFRQIAAGQIDQAYAQVSPTIGVDEATWKSGKRSLQAQIGAPVRISIAKVTVYDNPSEAPEPGLYVAADYDNEFSNAPIHCGYLMWFRPVGGEFRISREQVGHVTTEQLKSVPAAQQAQARQQLRCGAP